MLADRFFIPISRLKIFSRTFKVLGIYYFPRVCPLLMAFTWRMNLLKSMVFLEFWPWLGYISWPGPFLLFRLYARFSVLFLGLHYRWACLVNHHYLIFQPPPKSSKASIFIGLDSVRWSGIFFALSYPITSGIWLLCWSLFCSIIA